MKPYFVPVLRAFGVTGWGPPAGRLLREAGRRRLKEAERRESESPMGFLLLFSHNLPRFKLPKSITEAFKYRIRASDFQAMTEEPIPT